MDDMPMVEGDSLDDIIRDNDKSREMNRRKSLPPPYPGHTPQGNNNRRLSMLELDDVQSASKGFESPQMSGSATEGGIASVDFSRMVVDVGGEPSPTFTRPDMPGLANSGDVSDISHDRMDDMMSLTGMNVARLLPGPSSISLYTHHIPTGQYQQEDLSTTSSDFPVDVSSEQLCMDAPGTNSSAASGQMEDNDDGEMPVDGRLVGSRSTSQHRDANGNASTSSPGSASPTTAAASKDPRQEKTIYSKSGFDMIRALYYVATRPKPEVQLGAVDMSCAFVVCDVTQNDCPIIYVSDNFQNLTGYNRYEIMGQNCRFLQAPDGKVEAGSRREFVENGAVYNLKRKIAEGKEVQQSLINYRKGGKPFLNLLTMIPIPWDQKDEVRYFVGFQIDLVECPDAISGQEESGGTVQVNYTHSEMPQYVWNPPKSSTWEPKNGQTLGVDDVSTLLQQFSPKGATSDWHKQSWDKMLLENTDDVVHVLSLKGLFLYLSPSCRKVLEYDSADLVGSPLSSMCHPSDIVPVMRELKDTQPGSPVNVVFRIRRKRSGYTWFESHGSLFVEQGKGRKCIILVGRKRPVFALDHRELDCNGGIGDNEMWTKLSTSGMFLFVSSNVRSLLDLQPEDLEGTGIQDLMRKESRAEFGRSIEKARRGKIVSCKHEVQNRRGQVLQAQTVLYPGDAGDGQKPTFLLAQTKLLKASSRSTSATKASTTANVVAEESVASVASLADEVLNPVAAGADESGTLTAAFAATGPTIALGSQEAALEADDNIFDELKTTRCTSWQYELRQMEKMNRALAEELVQLLSNKKKRKRRKGVGNIVRDCANCHTRNTPEWRRGPSGQRDLCNSCGLRWAKQTGRVSPRNSLRGGSGDYQSKKSSSPTHLSPPLQRDVPSEGDSLDGNAGPSYGSNADNQSSMLEHDDSHSVLMTGIFKTTSIPPPSQPMLEGGSGAGGGSMEMTSIREEKEYGT